MNNLIPADPSQADPQVVALMHGLKQQESGGNYTQIGDKGTAAGAGQWSNQINGKPEPLSPGAIPTNFKTDAQQFKLNPDDFSPANQNQVMYGVLAQDKAQGLSPEQALSKWNSGDPNKYLSSGASGVGPVGKYDTATYVNNAMKDAENYNKPSSDQSNPALASTLFGPGTAQASDGTQTTPKKSNLLPILATGAGLLGAGALAIGTGGAAIPEEIAAAEGLGGLGAAGEAASGAADATAATGASGAADASNPGFLGKVWNGAKSSVAKLFDPTSIGEGVGGYLAGKTVGGITGGILGNNSGTNSTDGSNAIIQNEDNLNTQNQQQQQEILDAQNASKQAQGAYQQVLQGQAGGRKMLQDPLVQQGIQALSNHGIVPTTNDGAYATQGDQERVDNLINIVHGEENQLHDAEGGTGSINEIVTHAKARIREKLPIPQWQEADKVIDEGAQAYRQTLGTGENNDVIPLGSNGAGRIRSEGYRAFDRNSSTASNEARKALGTAANTHMLERSKSSEVIAKLHKEKQKLVFGKKILKQLDTKKVADKPGIMHGLLRSYGKYAGVAIGDKLGGALGAVIGDMVGTHLTHAVDKKYGTHLFDTPGIKKGIELLQSKNPAVHAEVVRELKKHGLRKEAERQEVIKSAHQLWQEQQMKDKKETKRKAYKETKAGLLRDEKRVTPAEKAIAEHYEPYSKDLPLIQMGKTTHTKSDLPVAEGSPKVAKPTTNEAKQKAKKKALYETYMRNEDMPSIPFGKGTSKYKKTVKGLLTIR